MPIVNVGIDIVEVARISSALENPRFAARILTPGEILLGLSPIRVAGRWAAKEAVAKSLPFAVGWQDVEILNDLVGAPFVRVLHPRFEGFTLHVSISHEKGYAAAVAVLEK